MKATTFEKQPWKTIGYRGFSEFIASDDDFFVLRRFSTLTARILLLLQDELSELESQLEVLEVELSGDAVGNIHNGSFRQEGDARRLKLAREVDKKLRAYNELVIQHSQLRKRPQVPDKDIDSVANWFGNHPLAIDDEETKYIRNPKDLFALVPKAKTPLRKFLEKSRHFRLLPLFREAAPGEDTNVHYSSDRRIDKFVALIVTLIGVVMLIAPLWILAFVERTVDRLAIITAFLVVFLIFVSSTTVARPFETLGAAAA